MKSISSNILINEAKKMWYTVSIISNEFDIFVIKNKWQKRIFKNIDCWLNTSLGVRFSRYKNLSYFILNKYAIKVPQSFIISKKRKIDDILDNIKKNNIDFPVVIKPATGEHGNGVSVNITTQEELILAIKNALKFHHQVIIQEFFPWNDYRLFVVNHKLVAAIQRIPACVIGNGKSTIKKLIQEENQNPLRWDQHTNNLTKIKIDTELRIILKNQWLTLQSIIAKNKKLFLRKNANLSTWGTSVDITDKIHPEIKKMAEKASKVLQLHVCGIDYLSVNISTPLAEQKWGIIEANHTPWLRWHHFPTTGKPRNVAKKILQLAFKK